MREHLVTLGLAAKQFLEEHLPATGEDWWSRGVVSALSYQQRQLAAERGWSSLDDLDVAALLRVIDGNWDTFRQRNLVGFEARNWLKESASIRNRVAHESPSATRDLKRDYRDLDTLALLAGALGPASEETKKLVVAREAVLSALAPAGDAPQARGEHQAVGAAADMAPGSQVRLVARPEIVGLVSEVKSTGAQGQVVVFHDGALHTYFESQVEPATIGSGTDLDPTTLRAGLTAELLLNPATSRLYSFNSGRIDYEPYQFRPVMKLISADRPRLLIADDVGVGKTIEAGLIIKELQARQKLESVLIICPKQLVVEGKWRSELKRFDEDFVELDSQMLRYCIDETRLEGQWPSRYRKAILPYSLLDERLLMGEGEGRAKRHGLLSLLPPVKFDLVIVDEAHHVRNRDTWRHRVVDHLFASAEAAVLVSATPIQTGSTDLFNLLRLLRPDVLTGPAEFDRMREPNGFIAAAEALARRGEPNWQFEALVEFEKAIATAWGSAVLTADPRAEAVRALLESDEPTQETRVRIVRILQGLNTFSGLINRTRRRDIGSFTMRKPETVLVDFTPEQKAIHEDLLDICARILATRQRSQSIEFLLSTLKRQASSSINGLAPFIGDLLEGRLSAEELSEADFEGDSLPADELAQFRVEIRDLAERASRLLTDPKLDALIGVIDEKQTLPNNKLLVFSTFRHTLSYVLPRLEANGVRVGLVHGGVPDRDRRDIRARFALERSDPEALDVLLSSEVGTEGLDNQFCDALVNYDIPWNPMRIEQRIGRIDRRGQESETVSVKNLVVSGTVDAAIYERCLWRIGIFRESLGASEEILGELTREMRTIADDMSLTPAERDAKLQQLADNKLGRIQEQNELEDRQASLFGLVVQKLDEDGITAAASPWLSSRQLAGLVSKYLAEKGYARAGALFDRPIAILRPDKTTRAALLQDTRALGTSGAVIMRWIQWLEGSGEGSRRLTFDPQLADKDDVELLSLTHPLVRAAAAHVGSLAIGSTVALSATSTSVVPGRHPFAIFGWRTIGLRDEYEIKVLATDPSAERDLEAILITAESGNSVLHAHERDALDAAHYDRWASARAEHIEKTELHVAAQLASLRLSHTARVAQLEDQLAEASHPNIVRMRESELRSAEEDFERRSAELRRAIERSDVTTTLLCSGVLEVR